MFNGIEYGFPNKNGESKAPSCSDCLPVKQVFSGQFEALFSEYFDSLNKKC